MDAAVPDTGSPVLDGSLAPSADVPGGLLEGMKVPAYVVDAEGLIIAANGAALRLLHRPAAELLGHDAHDLLHRDSHGRPLPRSRCEMRDALLAERTGHNDLGWFARGDGSLLGLSWFLTPYALDPDRPGALVMLYQRHEPAGHREDGEEHATALTELDRLALLAETTTQLTSTLDVTEALHRLAALTVPLLADWAVVDLLTENDEVRRALVVQHKDGVLIERADLQGPMPPLPQESPMPLSRALRGAASSIASAATYQGPPDSGIAVEQHRLFEETGMHSAAIAPIRGLRDVLGALTLGRAARPDAFTASDLPLLEDVTRRAGLALDNARLYQRQRKVSETMQRHLLPQMPTIPGLQMTARYVAAPQASQVGGDWYDAFPLMDGATALAIGDVVGHDLDAAGGMAQVRNMLRAFAWSHPEAPSDVVTQLDQAVMHIAEVPMATVLLARLTSGDDGLWRLRWTNAGHPPPLLVDHDGRTRFLTGGHGILLGTGTTRPREDAVVTLPPRSTLVLYTDGLVESTRHSIDDGLDRLRKHAASLARRPLDPFSDALLDRARPTDNDDDVAFLALRTPDPAP
ncbi:SpoIIE family protein phosphatase [Actinacidiphila glaucinigra]|uniref:protein-serine/threonine phosphatase n=1 Tax=Actinacidiphila glaucinigra TaxID=235986 RepID=A0A239N8D3_9ACTN|nr:SpoIIE family protein phosphatase [Actinacidiphila glaucinigra]SNT50704.1 Serine phosphatase RsbU, regulator of sigma subunit [Actinacidiphila glaucinigra]